MKETKVAEKRVEDSLKKSATNGQYGQDPHDKVVMKNMVVMMVTIMMVMVVVSGLDMIVVMMIIGVIIVIMMIKIVIVTIQHTAFQVYPG